MILKAVALSLSIGSVTPEAPHFWSVDDMSAVGCCALRNGTNGWDWSDKVTREQCLRDARAVGLQADGVYHYPKETCSAVKTRCGSPNPCN
jgi:hypothetical protein